jgi:hypothetical protein
MRPSSYAHQVVRVVLHRAERGGRGVVGVVAAGDAREAGDAVDVAELPDRCDGLVVGAAVLVVVAHRPHTRGA